MTFEALKIIRDFTLCNYALRIMKLLIMDYELQIYALNKRTYYPLQIKTAKVYKNMAVFDCQLFKKLFIIGVKTSVIT